LSWKANGEDPVEYFAATPLGSAPGAAKAPAAKGKGKGGAPPAPKGGFAKPPPPEAGSAAPPPPAAGGGMAQCMADIAKFKDGTGGLKKVTNDMKAKNMKDVPVLERKTPAAPAKKAAVGGRFAKGPKGDPVKYLREEHSSWIVENIDNDSNCLLDAVEMSQNVRITDCARSTINITSQRVKSIIIDNCEKVNIITKDVISIVELVNSDRCQIQTNGRVNMLSIDKCNGVMLHLNKESIGAEIVTAKSSEMNVQIPDDQGDEYDTIEIPIPEQFESKIVGRKIVTKVSSLYSE
jgi:adenylyl cyclase-associated protein